MIDFFPLGDEERKMTRRDFQQFSQSFAEILKKRLPTAQAVKFIEASSEEIGKTGVVEKTDLMVAVGRLHQEKRSFLIVDGHLLLPFFSTDGVPMVAVVEGADPIFLKKVGEDWLAEVKASCEREFFLLKEARCDPATGLLNIHNLRLLLGSDHPQASLHLLLVELLPKRMSCRYGIRHIQRCATLLRNFLQREVLLHHLGNAIFALVLPLGKDSDTLKVERTLLAYLKREGCHRVHIGSSTSDALGQSHSHSRLGRELLDQAWTALQQAERRGPFSFCAFSRLAHPENHPLPPFKPSTFNKFTNWTRHEEVFAVALFRGVDQRKRLDELLPPVLDGRKWLVDGSDLAVLLKAVDVQSARKWAEEVIGKLKASGEIEEIFVGMSGYPFVDYSKKEVLVNCRKALYHATFLDGIEVVTCDAISLNLSGDVYFGDGHLARAVSEYRRGLLLDASNVNLQNSLGVTLAMMNRLALAKSCFERALHLDPHNFMALYNLGLAEQAGGRLASAYGYLEEAVQRFDGKEIGPEALADLEMQVGVLAGDLGHHRRALEHLLAWKQVNGQGRNGGKVCYYLGRAYWGLGEVSQAMVELQRALQFNEFDDRAMHLLGAVYLRAGEGDDIALALCQKSVDLEPSNDAYRLTLAEAQLACGRFEEARENLRRLLLRRHWRGRAQVLMGRYCLSRQEHALARRWFSKALRDRELDGDLVAEAKDALACYQ